MTNLGTAPGQRHPLWAVAYVLQTNKRLISPRLHRLYRSVQTDAPPFEREMTTDEREVLEDCARIYVSMAAALREAAGQVPA